jgi:hypothetical protein
LDRGEVSVKLSGYGDARVAYIGFPTESQAKKVAEAWGASLYEGYLTFVVAPTALRDFVLAFDNPAE